MAIGWLVASIALFVLLFVVALCRVSGEAEEASRREISEPVWMDAATEAFPSNSEEEIHPQPSPVFVAIVTDEEITMAAKTVWGEARGIESRMEQAGVVWCLLNRVDKLGDSLGKICSATVQFNYSPDYPTVDDYGRDLEGLVRDVVSRWEREKNGETDVGRVLPKQYLWFGGEDGHNWFRNTYEFNSATVIWGWTLPDPYEGR